MKTVGAAIGIARRRIAHARGGAGIELHALEARQTQPPAIERRFRVDAHAPFAMSPGLVERDGARIQLGDVQQKVAIADARQPILLFRRRQAGHVIDLALFDAQNTGLGLVGQRRLIEKGFQAAGAATTARSRTTHHQLVAAEGLPVEIGGALQSERAIDVRLVALPGQRHRIDAEIFHQSIGDRAVRPGTVDQHRPAIHQFHPPAGKTEFIALGVAAEVIVIVEDQDFRVGPGGAIEMRRRETGNAAAHHDQVVNGIDIFGLARGLPEISVTQFMRDFERAGMAAAHAGALGRIVTRLVLRAGCLCGPGLRRCRCQSGRADRHAIEKIAAVDIAIHAQIPVAGLFILAAHPDPV